LRNRLRSGRIRRPKRMVASDLGQVQVVTQVGTIAVYRLFRLTKCGQTAPPRENRILAPVDEDGRITN
jgi:hypothetical protein